MVTIRQFAKGIGRAARAMERDARRAQRQHALHQKAVARQALLDQAAHAADQYERWVRDLTRAHAVPFHRRDWASVAAQADGAVPERSDRQERAARIALETYAPNWFERKLGLADARRRELNAAVERARALDDGAHARAVTHAELRRADAAFARSVLALEDEALVEAARRAITIETDAIEDISLYAEDSRVVALLDAPEIDDMPTQSVSLLASGKASMRNLAPARIAELHRDTVCSGALRVAAEVLMAIPVASVEVVSLVDLLDRASGHLEARPVLYLKVAAQALEAVNLQRADADALADRLGASFYWSRKEGFSALDLRPYALPWELLDAL